MSFAPERPLSPAFLTSPCAFIVPLPSKRPAFTSVHRTAVIPTTRRCNRHHESSRRLRFCPRVTASAPTPPSPSDPDSTSFSSQTSSSLPSSPSHNPVNQPNVQTHAQLQSQPSPESKVSTRKLAIPGVIFLIVTYIWSIILIIPMLIAHPFVLFFDRTSRRFHDVIAMAWMRCSLWTVRVRPKVLNQHLIPTHTSNVVYVANHTSYLDIFVFAYLFRRIKYVSKAEIFKIPIVGWAMQMAGNIALVRASTRGQMEAYRKMVRTLAGGVSLVIFPEGTRSETGVLRRFKPGAFRAAKQKKALVVPITILGTREIMPSSAYVPLHYPKDPIQLVIHPPIDSSTLPIDKLTDAAFRAIDSALPLDVRTYTPTHPTQEQVPDDRNTNAS